MQSSCSKKHAESFDPRLLHIYSLCGIILMFLVTLYVLWKLKKKNIRQLKIINSLQDKLSRQTEEYSRNIQKNIADMTVMENKLKNEKDRNKELEHILDNKNQLLAEMNIAEGKMRKDSKSMSIVVHSQIYKDIIASLNSKRRFLEDDWDRLDVLVNQVFPSFKSKLDTFTKLSEQEYHTCMLLKIGLSIGDIAKLTLRMDNSVSMLRKRLAVKMFGNSCSAADLDAYIKAL